MHFTSETSKPLKMTGKGKGPTGQGSGVFSIDDKDPLLSFPDWEPIGTGSNIPNALEAKRAHPKDLMKAV